MKIINNFMTDYVLIISFVTINFRGIGENPIQANYCICYTKAIYKTQYPLCYYAWKEILIKV